MWKNKKLYEKKYSEFYFNFKVRTRNIPRRYIRKENKFWSTTLLSQVCICGRKVKKPLSQRLHICECGVIQQRDIFSAYLAMYVVKNKLDYITAFSSYTGFEQRLWLATEDIKNLSSSSKKILGIRNTEIESLANLMLKKKVTVSSN